MSQLIITKQGTSITVMAEPGHTYRDWHAFVEAVKAAGLFEKIATTPAPEPKQ